MNKRSIGDTYEQIAAAYLESEGYKIIEHNFRNRQGEIDIIAKKDGYLRFIEIKYRKDKNKGRPEEAVDIRKQHQISKVALYYLMKNKLSMETMCCFDVVCILDNEIKLYENAFEYCN